MSPKKIKRDGSIDTVITLTGWTVRGLNPVRSKRFILSPKPPDRLWVPCAFLFDGYREFCTPLKCLGVRLSIASIQCRSWEWMELYVHFSIRLLGLYKDNVHFSLFTLKNVQMGFLHFSKFRTYIPPPSHEYRKLTKDFAAVSHWVEMLSWTHWRAFAL
jgi:hypothetical protein